MTRPALMRAPKRGPARLMARQTALPLEEPPPSIERDAKFSDEQPNPLCRWTLYRRWAPGPVLLYAGLNPSLAGADRDDPTCKAWMYFGGAWGYGAFIAINPIPKISPSPTMARDWYERGINWVERDRILNINFGHIRDAAKQAEKVVVCWGAATWLPKELIERLYATLAGAGHKELFCFGRNADGSPIHPMARGKNRIRRDAEMQLWRAA